MQVEGPDILPDDVVRVIDDMAEVHRLQKAADFGWNDDMALVGWCIHHITKFSITVSTTHCVLHSLVHDSLVSGSVGSCGETVERWFSGVGGEWKEVGDGCTLSRACTRRTSHRR